MEQNYFLFDKILPFIKYGNKLEKLNLYQTFIQRFGIGKTISFLILKNSGIHFCYKFRFLKENDINMYTKFIFFNSEKNLDNSLDHLMKISLQNSVDLYDYRGSRYVAKLPINGQRRRANKKTAKKIRPIIISQ